MKQRDKFAEVGAVNGALRPSLCCWGRPSWQGRSPVLTPGRAPPDRACPRSLTLGCLCGHADCPWCPCGHGGTRLPGREPQLGRAGAALAHPRSQILCQLLLLRFSAREKGQLVPSQAPTVPTGPEGASARAADAGMSPRPLPSSAALSPLPSLNQRICCGLCQF